MRVFYSQLLAICGFQAWGAIAFIVSPGAQTRPRKPSFSLHSTVSEGEKSNWDLSGISNSILRCEGQSRKTFDFRDLSKEVVQLGMTTEGRPLEAEIQLWIGPDWVPFKVKVFSEDGRTFPVQSLIGTRKKSAQVEVRNAGPLTLPFTAACSYAKPPLSEIRDIIPQTEEARRVQGAGAVYSFPLEQTDKGQARVFLKTDTRQLNARVELLNGPNNVKQKFEVFTNNGVLNSLYVVFETPGTGYTIRIINLAPVEFPAYAFIKQL